MKTKIRNIEFDCNNAEAECILSVELAMPSLGEALALIHVLDAGALTLMAASPAVATEPEPKPTSKKRTRKKATQPVKLFMREVGDVSVAETANGFTLTVLKGEHKDLTASGDTRAEAQEAMVALVAVDAGASDPNGTPVLDEETPEAEAAAKENAKPAESKAVRVETSTPIQEKSEPGDIPMELVNAPNFRGVMKWMFETFGDEQDTITAKCEELRDSVPAIGRIGDIPDRVQRALDVIKLQLA